MKAEKKVLIFKNLDEISGHAADMWLDISEEAVKKRGRFIVALSGGSTPVTFYKKLASLNAGLQWDKTDIFIVDERFVPYDDIKSNFRLVKEILLDHINIPGECIHPIPLEGGLKAAVLKYESDMRSFFSLDDLSFPAFDLILLGLGSDGHTASLFPGRSALKEKNRLTAAVRSGDNVKQERVTITLPVINNAENIIFMASGAGKAEVIKEVIEDKGCKLPAAMVKPIKKRLAFLIDEGAGSLLTDR